MRKKTKERIILVILAVFIGGITVVSSVAGFLSAVLDVAPELSPLCFRVFGLGAGVTFCWVLAWHVLKRVIEYWQDQDKEEEGEEEEEEELPTPQEKPKPAPKPPKPAAPKKRGRPDFRDF